MFARGVVGAVLVAVMLACGGGGAALLGSSVGPYATSMAEHYAAETPDVPCLTYAVGDEITMGDFTYRVDEMMIADGESSLPWIRNLDERRSMARDGVKALVMTYSVRNDSPVRAERDGWMTVYGTDGEDTHGAPYNMELYREEHGLPELLHTLPPGAWQTNVWVVGMPAAAADGAVAHLVREEEQFDPTDARGRRKIDVLLDQAIIDLGTPTPGPHLNPEKREASPTAGE